MKKCPTCNQTYAEDTLSFCLDDGSLLSALSDPEETLILGADDPTVRATNSDYKPEKSTATSFTQPKSTSSAIRDIPTSKTSPHLIYAAAGLIAVLGISGMILMFTTKTDEKSLADAPGNSAAITQPNRTVSTPTPKMPTRQAMTLPANQMWVDSGVSVSQGGQLTINATGQWSNSGNEKFVNADGYNNGWPGIILESGHIAQLIGKIGSNIFPIGQHYSGNSPASGRLYLSMNDKPNYFNDNFGSLEVTITTNGSANTGTSNVPTVKQMQDDIETEVKKMEDEANR